MNKLSTEEKVRVVSCLVEGNSLRATVRMTGIHRTTILRLLVDLGKACSEYQDKAFRNLTCKRVQCDEIWSFIGAKEKNTTEEQKEDGWGDIWTWVAMDAQTKLVPCWFVGTRDGGAAYHFIHDLAGRLAHRVQLTTDGHKAYLDAVEDAFGADIATRSSSRFTATCQSKAKSDTARQCAWALGSGRFPASPITRTFPPALLNAKTSQCGWACADSRG